MSQSEHLKSVWRVKEATCSSSIDTSKLCMESEGAKCGSIRDVNPDSVWRVRGERSVSWGAGSWE